MAVDINFRIIVRFLRIFCITRECDQYPFDILESTNNSNKATPIITPTRVIIIMSFIYEDLSLHKLQSAYIVKW